MRKQGEEIRKLKDGITFMDTAFIRTEDMRELEKKVRAHFTTFERCPTHEFVSISTDYDDGQSEQRVAS